MQDMGAAIAKRAEVLNRAGDYAEAENLYDMLLTQNHDEPNLLATLGTLYLHDGRKRYGAAISFLERAALKIGSSDVYCNLAAAYKFAERHDKADHFFRKATDHPKPSATAFANYGACFVGVGNPDKAIEIAGKGIALDKDCAIAHWNMGMALLEKGDWERGWDECEWGLKSKMRIDRQLPNFDGSVLPYWDGSDGKRVIVYGEQGIGDEIMFASMLPEVIEKNTVIFECHKRLQKLFEHSFPGLVCIGSREETEVTWPLEYENDARISIGSLGKFYRRSRDKFPGTPYLKAEPLPKGEQFRIGISWTGGHKPGRVAVRSIPLSWWKPILDNHNCEFVSLQYTECAEDLKRMADQGYDIKVMDEYVKAEDYYETARLVASCDLVITCCTSVVHLAGALGVPCWVMVPSKPAWRYGIQGGCAWYRSVRLYRQPQGEGHAWTPVIDRIAYDLSEKIGNRIQVAA